MPEQRVVLRNCGVIDPGRIATYLDVDGFQALNKARGMTAEQLIQEIKDSGLRGRGGAGFPCGLKWELTKNAPGNGKYIICNADEGEVGTFKDRYILTNDPFTLIEGMTIAGHATGAGDGYIYLRAEYHYLSSLLTDAIEQARAKRNHFFGAPKASGPSRTSGGTGKKLDSAKLSTNNAVLPCFV